MIGLGHETRRRIYELVFIIFQMSSLVSFPHPILYSSGIDKLATSISPNFVKLSHGFLFPPLSASHDN